MAAYHEELAKAVHCSMRPGSSELEGLRVKYAEESAA
jgi:hypothetical protein